MEMDIADLCLVYRNNFFLLERQEIEFLNIIFHKFRFNVGLELLHQAIPWDFARTESWHFDLSTEFFNC